MIETTRELLASLSSQQIKVLRTYLVAFARRGNNGTKLKKLFEILIKGDKLTLEQCAYILYGKGAVERTSKLLQRLHSKILDSLLIDINTTRLAQNSEHNYYVLIRLKKQLLQYYVLSTTGTGRAIGQSILKKIFSTATKYEFYNTNQEVLPLLKAATTSKTKVSTYAYWDECIRKNERAKEAYQRSFDFYNRYREMIGYHGKLAVQKHLDFLTESVATLSVDYKETGSATCGYFMGVLQTALYEQKGQFENAIATCKSLVKLVEENVSIRYKSRLAVQYSNIAVMEFQLGHLREALVYNKKSIASSIKGSSDEYFKLKQQVEILYYLEEYSNALELNSTIQSAQKIVGELQYAISCVFDAAIHFRLANYKEALNILNQKSALSIDKSGWELSVRVLRLITLIEMSKLEEAETVLANINRFAQRHAKSSDITKRDKEIIRFLNEWSKSSFSFLDYSERTSALVKKLSLSPDTEWKYGTPELVPIDDWFLLKTKKKRGPKPGKKMKSNA